MPIDLYQITLSSPCRAVLMLVRHLKMDVNLKFVNLFEGEHLKPEFMKMNPQHCVPTLDDNGFVLWESRAIMQYLVNQYYPGHALYPLDAKKRATIDRLLQFDQGSLFAAISGYIYPQVMEKKPADPEKEQTIHDKLKLLNTFLEGNKYVAGHSLSLADLAFLASVTTLQSFLAFDITKYGNVTAWIGRLQSELPYYDETVTEPCEKAAAFTASKLSESK